MRQFPSKQARRWRISNPLVRWQIKGQPVKASISRGIGRLLQINFSLALLLTTRNSPWSALLGVGFERYVHFERYVLWIVYSGMWQG